MAQGALDRAVVVTGASTGIGRAAVATAVREGAHVFASVRKQADADGLRTEFGEAVMAVVEPLDGCGVTPEDVRAHLARHLANYKLPRRIEIERNLPREDSGKIFKRKLRAPYWEKAGRSI